MRSMGESSKDSKGLLTFTTPRPGFKRPPVNEVALSVQFSPLSGMTVARFGALWERYDPPFSKTEDKPPLPAVIETFEPNRPQKLKLELVTELQPPRCWFTNDQESELIQVQSDRFAFNWRKGAPPAEYPRYEQVRKGFEKYFGMFQDYVRDKNLGPIVPTQCEVTYVNELPVGVGWSKHRELENVLALWAGRYSDEFLGDAAEDSQVRGRYIIRAPDGRPLGRLHYNLEPRVRVTDGSQLFHFILTARGAPLGEGTSGILAFLDLGREYVVRGFTSMTTKHMHEIWGRNQ